jgi:hypothetical protein
MASPKAAKAAPVATGGDLRRIEQLGGRLDLHATKSMRQSQYLQLRFGLSPIRAELVARLAYEARP